MSVTTHNDNNRHSKTQTHGTINSTINDVCQSKKITCLHAIESGSRAWGFASPDSDYDVRLLYRHEPNWYLRLFEGKATFEYIQDDLLAVPFDIGGWDIKKALTLIYKSNAVIFEWLNSPIVYQQDNLAIQELVVISQHYFNPIAAFHHYQGMAKTASKSLVLTEAIKFKKLFYLLRALLACRWIQTFNTAPPVVMTDMLHLLDPATQSEILSLIAIKKEVNECHTQTVAPMLQKSIKALWLAIESPDFKFERNAIKDKHDVAPLNAFYQQVVFNR